MMAILRRILPALFLLVLGTLMAFQLIPYELEQMHWEVPGMPESYPIEQKMRPILLLLLCYIPFIGAVFYSAMGTMSRYVSAQFITYFILCTFILLLIYILADYTDNMERFSSRFENPIRQSLLFYGTQLPMFLYQILPYTLLMGTLWCMSKLSSSCELTGMLQSGRSILRICRPIFLFSILIAMIYGICGFHWAPNGSMYRQITLKQRRSGDDLPAPIIYRSESTGRIWRIAQPSEMRQLDEPMRGVIIEQFASDNPGKLIHQIHAKEAKWNKKESTWTFNKVYQREMITPETIRPKADVYSDSITMDFMEKPYQIVSPSAQKGNESMGTSALYEFLSSNAGSSSERKSKRTEWHIRIARIFTCIVLVFIAIPSAVTFQRRSPMKGIGLAILMAALLLFFYRIFSTLGESGVMPAWLSAWASNFIYSFIAIKLWSDNLSHRSLKEWILSLFRTKV